MYGYLPKPIRKILTKTFCKKTPYLDEIGVDSYPRNNFGGINKFSELFSYLKKNRIARKTGVDPRDCWDMDTSFFQWLYCNCKQLLKDTNCDLTWRSYEHNGKTYTEGEYIEYLIDLCKQVLLFDEFKDCPKLDWDTEEDEDSLGRKVKWLNSEEELEKFREQTTKNGEELTALEKETFDVFYELLHALWW
jgi:hypothetical protein